MFHVEHLVCVLFIWESTCSTWNVPGYSLPADVPRGTLNNESNATNEQTLSKTING